MKKALVLILTAFLFVSLFIACGPEPEPKIELTIAFDGNGAEGEMDDLTVYKGEEVTLPLHTYIMDDHNFLGWNTEQEGTGDWYYDADTVSFDKDTTLYAQWYETIVSVKFNSNGGKGLMVPQWVKKGEATALRPNAYKLKDHVFIGWNTKKDGTGDFYPDKSEITTGGNVILYAQWAVDVVSLEDKYNWKESDSKCFSISADLTLDDRVLINGNVTLFLPEGKSLNLSYGIGVNKGNSLTIDGSGTLKADTSASMIYSGIGSYTQEYACGDITINGGNIYAEGGPGGAGIGGSCYVDGGTITINGGTVEAVGGSTDWLGYGGAGIGGGGKGSGGIVIINGGKVTVKGGENSDGIGKGQEGKDKGKLTLGKGVTIEVSDDGKTWSPYKSDERHRYMRTK
jgi:hypothetical protein